MMLIGPKEECNIKKKSFIVRQRGVTCVQARRMSTTPSSVQHGPNSTELHRTCAGCKQTSQVDPAVRNCLMVRSLGENNAAPELCQRHTSHSNSCVAAAGVTLPADAPLAPAGAACARFSRFTRARTPSGRNGAPREALPRLRRDVLMIVCVGGGGVILVAVPAQEGKPGNCPCGTASLPGASFS